MDKSDNIRKKKLSISAKDMVEKFIIDKNVIKLEEKGKVNRSSRPNISHIERVLEKVTSSANDNLAMMELLPDLKLVKKILVPSILSPKDLSSAYVRIIINSAIYDKEVKPDLIEAIEEHFRSRYNLEDKLSEILEQALFDTGSYCTLTIPESSLVDIVNGDRLVATESVSTLLEMNKQVFTGSKILGKGGDKLSKLGIETLDNPRHLLADAVVRQRLTNTMLNVYGLTGVGLEAVKDHLVCSIRGAHGENGTLHNNPLVMRIPSDTIIPIHAPGAPEEHVGYFIVLDGNGSILSNIKQKDHLGSLKAQLKKVSSGNALGGLIQSVGISIGGENGKDKSVDPNVLLNNYMDTVENELKEQMKNGKFIGEVEVSKPQSVYRLMLNRKLKELKTKLLFVPKELITYYAFDFNDYGIGKSLLEDTKIFGSLRAILLFAEVMAGVKNAVGRTKLNITLDEDDTDPSATIDAVIHQFAGLQTESLPLGHLAAGDIVRSLQKASIDVNVDGGEAFPGTKTEIIDNTRDHHVPDQELSQTLRRMQYSGFGIPPEIVDSAMEGELATVVVSRNQLFAKQVMEYAAAFERMVSGFIRLYTSCSGELIARISEDVDEGEIAEFIKAIEFTLPDPDLAGVRSQAEAYNEFSDAIDKAIEAYITEDMFSDLLEGEIDSRKLESLRITVGGLIKRDWMAQQNILPEIASKFSDPDTGKRIDEHNSATLAVLVDVIKRLMKDEFKSAKTLAKLKDKITAVEEEAPEEEGEVTEAPEGEESSVEESDTEESTGDEVEETEEGSDEAGDSEGDTGEEESDEDFNF